MMTTEELLNEQIFAEKYPDLMPLYDEIYNKKNRSYFEALEKKAEEIAKKYGCRFVDNETPYERVPQGHPTITKSFPLMSSMSPG